MIPPIPELEDYGLDPESGFMPAEPPLEILEDSYYAPWERLMDKFHGLLLAGRLREAVLKVPPLDCLGRQSDIVASDTFHFISRHYRREETCVRYSFISSAWLHMEWHHAD